MLAVILSAFAYLLASVPMGVAVCALYGAQDPRTGGSNNIGATNVARLNGWRLGGITLALDMAKGLLPALLAVWLVGPTAGAAAAICAVVGHCWSAYLGFSGGKGVATAAGAMLALAPTALLLAAAIWGGLFAVTRKSSVAGLTAAVLLPVICWALGTGTAWVAVAITAIIVLRHKSNIQRILAGREGKI
jgi:glycerol-3-phosphate acyltransferase PlsY